MVPISARIKRFANEKKISIRQFEQSIGASNGLLSRSISKKTDILSIWVSKIIEEYPELNPIWLLTGNGEMLKTVPKDKSNSSENVENIPMGEDALQLQLNYSQEIIKSKERIIELLEESVRFKDEKLRVLSSDNEKLKILLKACREKKNHSIPKK